MPFNWSEQAERNMLLLAICAADLKPTSSTWAMVAERMGGGLNASAVSQKFYKMKRESEKLLGEGPAAAPTTPTNGKSRGSKTGSKSSGGRKRKPTPPEQDEAEADDTPVKAKKAKKEFNEMSANNGNVGAIKIELPVLESEDDI